MLVLALLEGYLGYSLVDDLLSGMGLAIGYAVALSIPFVGANLGAARSGAGRSRARPRSGRACTSRTCSCCRSLIATLLALHLLLVASRHHTQFRGGRGRPSGGSSACRRSPARRRARSGCCSPSPRVLFLLGGLVQINPIWLWGPYHVADGDERRAARLVPRLADRRAAARCPASTSRSATTRSCRTRSGAACSSRASSSAFLFLWPCARAPLRRGDRGFHNLLDRPRDAPVAHRDRRRRS